MKSMRQEFADTMLEVGMLDERLIVMVGDISHTILQSFAAACKGRYFNIGICEPTLVNMAAGVAKSGLIPVVHTIAPFIIERAYEQIKLDFGYQKLGVNLISVGSAFDYAQLGCSHHCYADISLIGHFTDSHIFFPSSPLELNCLFKASYANGKINYFRLPEKTHGISFPIEDIVIGKAIVASEGEDLSIVVVGPQLANVLQAVQFLSKSGICVETLYYPTIKPFDAEAVYQSVKKTGKVLVVEEASAHDGVFNYVLKATRELPNVMYASLAIDDFIHHYGTYEEICASLGFSVEGILKKVDSFFIKNKQAASLSMMEAR